MRWVVVCLALLVPNLALAQSLPQNAIRTVNDTAVAGITLTGCTTFTGLNNAAFAVTPDVIGYISALRGVFKTNGVTFPTATQVPAVVDLSGTSHLIATLAELTALDNILSGYYWALQSYLAKSIAGQSPSLPATTSSTYGSC